MKRFLPIVGVLLGAVIYLFALSFYAPRQVFVFMLPASLIVLAFAFARKKARDITTASVVLVAAAFAAAPIDVRMVRGEKKKGLYFLPIDYGLFSRSVDQGYCPGGCIIDLRAPTHAVVFSF